MNMQVSGGHNAAHNPATLAEQPLKCMTHPHPTCRLQPLPSQVHPHGILECLFQEAFLGSLGGRGVPPPCSFHRLCLFLSWAPNTFFLKSWKLIFGPCLPSPPGWGPPLSLVTRTYRWPHAQEGLALPTGSLGLGGKGLLEAGGRGRPAWG